MPETRMMATKTTLMENRACQTKWKKRSRYVEAVLIPADSIVWEDQDEMGIKSDSWSDEPVGVKDTIDHLYTYENDEETAETNTSDSGNLESKNGSTVSPNCSSSTTALPASSSSNNPSSNDSGSDSGMYESGGPKVAEAEVEDTALPAASSQTATHHHRQTESAKRVKRPDSSDSSEEKEELPQKKKRKHEHKKSTKAGTPDHKPAAKNESSSPDQDSSPSRADVDGKCSEQMSEQMVVEQVESNLRLHLQQQHEQHQQQKQQHKEHLQQKQAKRLERHEQAQKLMQLETGTEEAEETPKQAVDELPTTDTTPTVPSSKPSLSQHFKDLYQNKTNSAPDEAKEKPKRKVRAPSSAYGHAHQQVFSQNHFAPTFWPETSCYAPRYPLGNPYAMMQLMAQADPNMYQYLAAQHLTGGVRQPAPRPETRHQCQFNHYLHENLNAFANALSTRPPLAPRLRQPRPQLTPIPSVSAPNPIPSVYPTIMGNIEKTVINKPIPSTSNSSAIVSLLYDSKSEPATPKHSKTAELSALAAIGGESTIECRIVPCDLVRKRDKKNYEYEFEVKILSRCIEDSADLHISSGRLVIPVPEAYRFDPYFKPWTESDVLISMKWKEMLMKEAIECLSVTLAEKRVFGPALMSQVIPYNSKGLPPLDGLRYIEAITFQALCPKTITRYHYTMGHFVFGIRAIFDACVKIREEGASNMKRLCYEAGIADFKSPKVTATLSSDLASTSGYGSNGTSNKEASSGSGGGSGDSA